MERRRTAKREQGKGDDFLDSPIDQRYPVGGMIMVFGKKATILMCSICLLFTFTGCGKKDVEPDAVSTSLKPEGRLLEGAKGDDQETGDSVTAGELEGLDKTGTNPLAEDATSQEYRRQYGRSTAPLMPVYFDFDSSSINVNQLDSLNDSGSYLVENSSSKLIVEGNCDERGTADYNLALGELRAINVKKYLVNIGVEGKRIKTLSYGFQRPLLYGSDEDSWAANRRADLVIP
jgi:peptidoglycan-associated lipoprotein